MVESNDCTTARMIANFCQLNCHNRYTVSSSDIGATMAEETHSVWEALDRIDAFDLPNRCNAEARTRLRNGIMQASERCIVEQAAEPDLLEPAHGSRWDDLSVEESASTPANTTSLYL
ncbi:hypothetical protein [Anaplasma phagocytophilum]|uniref:hypothetical protein n=1 Tax=Anaplasma phagocytophilum TaxID=948 RepID=UPI0012BB9672|nr:hypothetical protein [Anaplasma phagocytophilum]